MAIYTKTGDQGVTGLVGGRRVSKNDPAICAIGDIDELNSALGILLSYKPQKKLYGIIIEIQKELFLIGTELADPDKKMKKRVINESDVNRLEDNIDDLDADLPHLNKFILPGGTPFAAHDHMARAICRRAERSLVALNQQRKINSQIMTYINRLSDLLFVLGRVK